MSSLWGFTKIVVEGEKAKDVYELLCRAKQKCGREECGYRSEVICTGKGEYRFAFGMDIDSTLLTIVGTAMKSI